MTDDFIKGLKARRRRFGDHLKPALRAYTSLVGEVIWASNNLHGELLLLLQVIFPDGRTNESGYFSDNANMATELWHSLRSDDAQRSVLRAIAAHSSLITSKQRASINWVINSAGKLSSHRNDAAHTPFNLDWDEWDVKSARFTPSSAAMPKRAEKLERIGHEKLFKALIGDLNQLSDYTRALWVYVMNPVAKKPRMPKRPVLQSILLAQRKKTPEPPEHKIRVSVTRGRRKATFVPQLLGYVDGSKSAQVRDKQVAALTKAGCAHIFTEELNAMGVRNPRRPYFNLMLKHMQEGDTVLVHDLDSLSGSTHNPLKLISRLKAEGILVRSLLESELSEAVG